MTYTGCLKERRERGVMRNKKNWKKRVDRRAKEGKMFGKIRGQGDTRIKTLLIK